MFIKDGMKAAKAANGQGWHVLRYGAPIEAFGSRDQARDWLREFRANRQAILAKSAAAFSNAEPSNLTS